jgi:protein RecA
VARKSSLAKVGAASELASRINAQMKRDVVKMASDESFVVTRVPTGSLVIDRLTGGGFARGRHVLLYGDYMVGKSMVLYMTMALAQARGEVCALVDGEKVFNEKWFAALGGDPDSLILLRPKSANETANLLRLLIDKSGDLAAASIIGIDSVASLVPEEELKYDYEGESDPRVASQARLMSLLLRILTSQNDDTLFIWTNQWRDKISRIPGLRSTPGGRSLGFYSSTSIEMMMGDKETDKVERAYKGAMVDRKQVLGQWINCTLTKEKTGARPLDSASFMLDYKTRRIDTEREIIDLAMRDGMIKRQGDYYHIKSPERNGDIRVHGIKRTVAKLKAEEGLREFLVDCITESTEMMHGST